MAADRSKSHGAPTDDRHATLPPMSSFPTRQTDQHFIVTGAGTGIGRAIALRLAGEGARVSLMGRRLEPLQASAALIADSGVSPDRLHVASVDTTNQAAIDEAFAIAAGALGPLRGCVANAGIGGPNEPGPGDRFAEIVATNLNGTYHTLRAARRELADGPEARHFVVIASILARFGVPGYTGYCASKTALLGLTRALAMELAGDHVQVNAVCPGWVETDMAWEGIDGLAAGMGVSRDEALATAMSEVPFGRMSQPQDIAGLVAWLVSGDARGVTGQGIDMNGGAFMA